MIPAVLAPDGPRRRLRGPRRVGVRTRGGRRARRRHPAGPRAARRPRAGDEHAGGAHRRIRAHRPLRRDRRRARRRVGPAARRGRCRGSALFADCAELGAADAVRRRLAARERLPGFGHRIYRNEDPRFTVLVEAVRELPDPEGRLYVFDDLLAEGRGPPDPPPNIDLALAALAFVGGFDRRPPCSRSPASPAGPPTSPRSSASAPCASADSPAGLSVAPATSRSVRIREGRDGNHVAASGVLEGSTTKRGRPRPWRCRHGDAQRTNRSRRVAGAPCGRLQRRPLVVGAGIGAGLVGVDIVGSGVVGSDILGVAGIVGSDLVGFTVRDARRCRGDELLA